MLRVNWGELLNAFQLYDDKRSYEQVQTQHVVKSHSVKLKRHKFLSLDCQSSTLEFAF